MLTKTIYEYTELIWSQKVATAIAAIWKAGTLNIIIGLTHSVILLASPSTCRNACMHDTTVWMCFMIHIAKHAEKIITVFHAFRLGFFDPLPQLPPILQSPDSHRPAISNKIAYLLIVYRCILTRAGLDAKLYIQLHPFFLDDNGASTFQSSQLKNAVSMIKRLLNEKRINGIHQSTLTHKHRIFVDSFILIHIFVCTCACYNRIFHLHPQIFICKLHICISCACKHMYMYTHS